MQPINAQTILAHAFYDICQCAAAVGIDGEQLLANLPPSGQLVTGHQVPVLTPKDKGKAAYVFYLNNLSNGGSWPFFRFFSFRQGGLRETFNGWQWFKQRHHLAFRSQPTRSTRIGFAKRAATQPSATDTAYRHQRDQRLMQRYQLAQPLTVQCPWSQQRFGQCISASVLRRAAIKVTTQQQLLVPIIKAQQRVGFHLIDAVSNQKKHLLKQAGIFKGAYLLINAEANSCHFWPIICEGLATGLSLACVWPGQVIVALSANNLAPVRNTLAQPVIVAADNDQWKPHIGNTGLSAAYHCLQAGDELLLPEFSVADFIHKPTDFNDVLKLYGAQALANYLVGLTHTQTTQ